MSDSSKIREFPDISNKLTAPTKKSLFERQKAEAEAKRLREEAETAAVLQDFVKSFEGDDDDIPASKLGSRPGDGGFLPRGGLGGGVSGPPKRHFAGPLRNSGPGSLGPAPSLSRKRTFDGSHLQSRDREQGLFAYEDSSSRRIDAATEFQASDEEDEMGASAKAAEQEARKPTLHLSSLPPGTSVAVIKSIIPSNLIVESVKVLPPAAPSSTERKSMSAIVILAKGTPASDIDSAVNSLQKKYLGWGFYLSLSRFLSSSALGPMTQVSGLRDPGVSSLPFGARPAYTGPGQSLSRAPPLGTHRGGFAPPTSYNAGGPGQYGRGPVPMQVPVTPPSDLKQLKLIHKTTESLIKHGPEFEALLMSRPEVQKDEKWAWIWDSRSVGGIWYRWRIWEILSGMYHDKNSRKRLAEPQLVFDASAPWTAPEEGLRFEFTTKLAEFVSDSEYNSSDDEDSGNEGRRRHYHSGAPPEAGLPEQTEKAYLNPLEKARLTWLLATLPTTTARLRKGDVARVTAFAITHAGHGIEEVVDMLISNIEKPFAWSGANPDRRKDEQDREKREQDEKQEKEDPSSSKLIALYLISDILSASSTSGVRHAWRYRQLFENSLKQRKVFESLGRLDRDMEWGRLKAEKWKRSVSNVLALWEGWCVFGQDSQSHFMEVFANPPLTQAEKDAAIRLAAEEAAAKKKASSASKVKWKKVEVKRQQFTRPSSSRDTRSANANGNQMDEDIDGEPIANIDEEPMADIDGEPMDDIDGEPMDEDIDGMPMELEGDMKESEPVDSTVSMSGAPPVSKEETAAARARRQRPKAEDMFADSDDD
ncbi:hypothetical protein AOQ84DRAFT_352365 [Glonium stellatum]|uniref:CID domain-containing protein n=1 Tax=Glonium stellatum TaxID=574774 RepID=A0A8E2F8Y3_9PEZI|nr:hypothetical protein AOQ84DRAFT_352365 [Glonium stellatum]